jgi:predicted aconitase
VKGEQLKDWGASVELTFQPRCYDASTYEGIAFSARGPGRIYVALRQVDVIPPEFQGTCERDCYNAHVRKIDLSERFQEYEVRWNEVAQRGYGKPHLDATRLHDIAFQIRSEDTPYDVWIDTVRFIQR